jgi:hypothetical protein
VAGPGRIPPPSRPVRRLLTPHAAVCLEGWAGHSSVPDEAGPPSVREVSVEFPATSPEAVASFARVRDILLAGGAVSGRMMGMPMLFFAGKGFAGLWGDAMTFKLKEHDVASALDLPGANRFDPSGRNRPMKAWVAVPLEGERDWEMLGRKALDSAVARAR